MAKNGHFGAIFSVIWAIIGHFWGNKLVCLKMPDTKTRGYVVVVRYGQKLQKNKVSGFYYHPA